jgi:uncharacterized membrane-anchored protein
MEQLSDIEMIFATSAMAPTLVIASTCTRHCEERSDEAICLLWQKEIATRPLGARNDAK